MGLTAWDVVSAIDDSADGGLPARTPEFWEWVMRVLQEDRFPDAPQMPDDLPAWRYVPPASAYAPPAWQLAIKEFNSSTKTDEPALKDRWHHYLMYERSVFGCTYDEMLIRNLRQGRFVSGFVVKGVEFTDEFLDWAMWTLNGLMQEGKFDRGSSRTFIH